MDKYFIVILEGNNQDLHAVCRSIGSQSYREPENDKIFEDYVFEDIITGKIIRPHFETDDINTKGIEQNNGLTYYHYEYSTSSYIKATKNVALDNLELINKNIHIKEITNLENERKEIWNQINNSNEKQKIKSLN